MGSPTRIEHNEVLNVLSQVRDPETRVSITQLRLLDSVEVGEDGYVMVMFRPVSPYTPVTLITKLAFDIAAALGSLEGVTGFKVRLSGHPLSDYLNKSLNKVLGLGEKIR